MAKAILPVTTPLIAADWLASVAPERQADAALLLALFAEETGFQPQLWPGGIAGFGRYAYRYASGHAGECLATGFAPRKADISIYIIPGQADHTALLAQLGKHRMGKGCLYLRRLDDVDERILRDLICAGLADLAAQWPVSPA